MSMAFEAGFGFKRCLKTLLCFLRSLHVAWMSLELWKNQNLDDHRVPVTVANHTAR